MEKKHYVVIVDAPGSLIVEPPYEPPVVYFDERAGEEDGRSWVVVANGEVNRFHKQRYALKAAARAFSKEETT